MPGSYTILFFAALGFTFIIRHINNWASYLLWPSCFICFRAIGNSPPLSPSSILDTFRPGGLIFQCHIFLAFYIVHEVLTARILVVCHSLLQWIMFCQNSLLWLVCLGWPCMAWLIASLSCTSPFTTTRPWSMKGECRYKYFIFCWCTWLLLSFWLLWIMLLSTLG